MSDVDCRTSIRLEEYRLLRDEMLDNRRFVFERPLLVTGALFAASGFFFPARSLGLLTLPFLALLFFNLWFTTNRLLSNARIVSYLHLVHETEELAWIGWETALRKYREYLANQSLTKLDQQDHLRYFTPILWFHVVMGSLTTLSIVGQSTAAETFLPHSTRVTTGLLVLNVVAVVSYVVLSFYFFGPNTVKGAIERERATWLATLPPRSAAPSATL